MAAPFPGMDPFIEDQNWADFHPRLIYEIATYLTPALRPDYVATIEERLDVEHWPEDRPEPRRPDAISRPPPGQLREHRVEIRTREGHDAVTVIEVLSPANKRSGSDGRREYLRKRNEIIRSRVNLLEIDLLRAGMRLPMGDPLPPAEFYVILSRTRRRPHADVWPIGLADPLPTVPVPLAGADPEAALDLQRCLATVYDRAGYDYVLDYRRDPEPPLTEDERAWVRARLENR